MGNRKEMQTWQDGKLRKPRSRPGHRRDRGLTPAAQPGRYRSLTFTTLFAFSTPPSGPLLNSARNSNSPVCPDGTRTEAGQKVPQANPELVCASDLSPFSRATPPWHPWLNGPPLNSPR
jgi:hypothetical protein